MSYLDEQPLFSGEYQDIPWRFYLSADQPAAEKVTAVVCLAIKDEKVALVHNAQRGWELPGGHIEAGESFSQTAKREVSEEACYRVSDPIQIGMQEFHYIEPYKSYPFPTAYILYYKATITDFDESCRAELSEIDEYGLFSSKEASRMLANWYQKEIIALFLAQ